ncbi:alcohol dehydrogenase catalytic domain-containing protein [Clostridia bacterium]|nr:alcohol dehydrogenase catalytic domain-containing protein [Clostridia bacterium]
MENYKIAVNTGVHEISIEEREIKEPIDHQVLVKVHSCAICTLEQRMYSGVIKRYPFAGGHEAAGTVVAVGDKVKNFKIGDKVAPRMLTSCGECYYCRNGHENKCVSAFIANIHEGLGGPGGFSEYMMLEAKSLYKLADDLDLKYAALTEPLACCIHSINNANIQLGEDVVVVGNGIMGSFHIQLAKLKGARVIACEVDEGRMAMAKRIGADIVIDSSKVDPVDKVKELTEGRGANVVFCTAAFTALASQSIDMAGNHGRVVMYSSFPNGSPIELDVNRSHSAETIITGAVNSNKSEFLAATRLLSNKLIDVSPFISEVVPFERIEYAFERAIDPSTYRILVEM